MNNLKIFPIVIFAFFNAGAYSQEKKEIKKMDTFITELMKKMTVEEKLGQLTLVTPFATTGPLASKKVPEKLSSGMAGQFYGILANSRVVKNLMLSEESRLKIPLISGMDIIHGFKTVFPIPLGLSCSWDMGLIEKTAHVAAVEATAVGHTWTFSPMVDITRDPRWGRVTEGSGEDPWLGSRIAAAMVHGYQGDDLSKDDALLSCVKHFGMYGAAEAGRDYNTTDMSRITMYQNYLPPYKAAIDAGALSVMASFNEVDGVPATANKWLLTDLLRDQWNYKGFVVTDYTGIPELINHGIAGDLQEATVLALKAGIDMDMASEGMLATLGKSLEEKKITIKDIDRSCRRILEVKYKMGLFSNPYKHYDASKSKSASDNPEHTALALLAAQKSMVLLKNDNDILPLKRSAKLAVIGPIANNKGEMFGSWVINGDTNKVVSIVEGLQKTGASVTYAQGSKISDDQLLSKSLNLAPDENTEASLLKEALDAAAKADVIVAVLGESKAMSGEATSRSEINIPACQTRLLEALSKTGKPVVWVLMTGRPLTIGNELPMANAVLNAWFPGTEAGNAIASILYGDYNPSGKLTMTFPRSVGQIPIYYNHKNTGRPYSDNMENKFYTSRYLDVSNEPLFPFGFGLSYAKFVYKDLKLSKALVKGNETLKVSVQLTNTGKYSGTETVQLYLNDPVASVTRPVKELKNFKQVFLNPGASITVEFEITVEDLKFYNSKLQYDWEPGLFHVSVGTNSAEVLTESFTWLK